MVNYLLLLNRSSSKVPTMPPRILIHSTLTGNERSWGDDEIIVTKTDLKGHLTYANEVFLRVSQLSENVILGQPHNIIRHPDMPRCIFKLLWDRIQAKDEIFAYVVNKASSGDHYWVFAHVTASLNSSGDIVGYHSNRRKPNKEQVARIRDLYAALKTEQLRHTSPKEGLAASYDLLMKTVKDSGKTYDEYIFSF